MRERGEKREERAKREERKRRVREETERERGGEKTESEGAQSSDCYRYFPEQAERKSACVTVHRYFE